MPETGERELVATDFDAYREGDWIIVTLQGEVIHRRLTRDRAFTSAWIIFQSNRSPSYPKTRDTYEGVFLRGAWRPGRRAQWWNNRFEIPIRNA